MAAVQSIRGYLTSTVTTQSESEETMQGQKLYVLRWKDFYATVSYKNCQVW
jgi:hypothetical protein